MELRLPPRAQAFFDLTARIRVAAKAVSRAGETCSADGDLSRSEMTVLTCLHHLDDETTVPEMARHRGMKRQSVQAIVDGMIDRGLVELLDNPLHARSKLVRPTEAGKKARGAVFRVAAESMSRVAGRFRKRDLELACRVLEDVVKRIDETHPPE